MATTIKYQFEVKWDTVNVTIPEANFQNIDDKYVSIKETDLSVKVLLHR